MKKLFKYKSIALLISIVMLAIACTKESATYNFDNLMAPANITAVFDVTQDNTGLVTIFPNAEGAAKFVISFGDGSEDKEYLLGEAITHTYAEGEYTVSIKAIGTNGKSATADQALTVSFKAPENLVVTVENDKVVSMQVNISTVADYATSIVYDFGDGSETVLALPGDVVNHQYAAAGNYDITVVAKSAAIQTTTEIVNFDVTEILMPTTTAPTPPGRSPDNVVSIFSDAYTNITDVDFNPNWGQQTQVNISEIAGTNMLSYTDLNYQGTDFSNNHQDVSTMEFLHIDLWSKEGATVNLYCISPGPAEKSYELVVPADEWKSFDIPTSHFSDVVNLADLFQFKFDATGSPTIFIDNFYFYKGFAAPETSAPTPPTRNATDVISVFSDAYTNVTINDFNPNWGQGTVYSQVDIAGNTTIKYESLNYQGTDFGDGNHIDASSMDYLHIDLWTANASEVQISCISPGPLEKPYKFTIIPGQWNSYDIPLSHFSSVVDIADIFQFKFDDAGSGEAATIFLDNIYFYAAGTLTAPVEQAPIPSKAETDVISIFSDTYTNVSVDTYKTNWSVSDYQKINVSGSEVLKYSNLGYVGIETTTTTVDVSGMTHVHFDVWSADVTELKLKIVDFGTNGVWDGGPDDVEHEITVTAPTQGQWVSYDISLSDFTGLTTKANMAQYIFSGAPYQATTIYVDNFYFYK